MDKYYIKLFLRFLKENNAYDKYYKYTLKKTTDDIFNHLPNRILTNGNKGWVWSDSYEGRRFWVNIQIKWLKLLCNDSRTTPSDRIIYEKEIENFRTIG